MVADTDNHPINGEPMAMTINHSNREMTMFMDNMNGHHYENINVYHSNQHNNHHHNQMTNGKTVNSYLSKDRPNSANSYSLESNSSGSNTTESSSSSSSGTISSPLSGGSNRDDTHGDELQYGPGIVDKLRSKFLQYSLQTSSRANGYHRSVVKRCSSLENLADRDSPSSSPLFHHSTCNGNNYGIRKGPNYVKYHQHKHITSNNNNNNTTNNQVNHQHHYSSQSNHTKGNNHNGVDSGIDINGSGVAIGSVGGGGAAAGVINNINKGAINGKTFQSSSSTPTPTTTLTSEKRLQGESRNSCCLTGSRTTNGFTSSSSSSSGRNYRKYEQQPIKSNHYHHLNQHSSIYHNHNHRYNCDGLLKRAQSVETLLLESRNSTKSTTSTSSTSTFTNCNNINNNSITTTTSTTIGANCYNSNLNSTRLTSTTSNLNTNLNSTSSSNNSVSENCELLPLSLTNQQQSRWQSTNNNTASVNSPPPPPQTTTTTTTSTSNKVNSVSQVCNHLVTKQQDFLDTVATTTTTTVNNTCKKMSSEDNIVGVDGLPPSESKLKSSTLSTNLTLTSDKKMIGDITTTINNNSDHVNHGPRKLAEDELPKPDTVKNCKKIFETNSVSPTPLTGPLSPSSSSSNQTTTPPTTNDNNSSNINHNNNNNLNCSSNESDSRNNGGQAYRKGGIYGSSNSAIRRKPPVLSSIEKKITVNKVTINNNHNTANNNNNNCRLINGSGTSSSPTSPALPPKPPFLINKKSPLNGELNHVNVNNNNYLSAIKPIGKLSPNESNKNKINSGKSSTINGSKDRNLSTINPSGSSNNLVNKSKPLLPSQSTLKPKLINSKSDESPPSSSRSSSSSSSPLLSPSSSFIPPSPLISNGSTKCVNGDDNLDSTIKGDQDEDTIDGCPLISSQLTSSKMSTINGQFSLSLDKETDKSLINNHKINSDQRPTSTTVSTTTSSMITNKPIANIKPIQLEVNDDHHRWKSTINKKSTSDPKLTEKVFPSLGVTNTINSNHNLINKDQTNHELNCLPSETKLTSSTATAVTSESNNHHNNDRNKINHSNNVNNNNNKSISNNKKIEVDEKSNNNTPIISKDNPTYGTIKSRSYLSPSSIPTTTTTAKLQPTSGTSMIFDFRGKNVKANVAVHSPPFSVVRPPSSSASTVGNGRSDDNEDDYNYTGSTEVPKPSGIIFKGENIIIDGGSLLIKRNKKLTISFDDKATSTFEYPSETSFFEDSMTANFGSTSQQLVNSDESTSVIQQQSTNGSSLKNNTTLGGAFSGGLASYKPTFLASESASFQLGVSRVIKGESDNIKSSNVDLVNHHNDEFNQSADQDDDTSFNMIKPAEPSETASWSTSSTALDLLF